jgi:hypothetical protein
MSRVLALALTLCCASLAHAWSDDDGAEKVQAEVVAALAAKGLRVAKADVRITGMPTLPNKPLYNGESFGGDFSWSVRLPHKDGEVIEVSGTSAANIRNDGRYIYWSVPKTQINHTNAAADRAIAEGIATKERKANLDIKLKMRTARIASLTRSAEAQFADALVQGGAKHVPMLKASHDAATDKIIVETSGPFKLGENWVSGRGEIGLVGGDEVALGAMHTTYRPESLGFMDKWRAKRLAKQATQQRSAKR